MYELLSTIFSKEDIVRLKKVNVTGIIVGDDFHGTRLTKAFSHDEIIEINKLAKENDLKVYVKMNRMYEDKELDKALDYLKFLKTLDVNIFYNDLSIYVLAKSINMEDRLVYDPDTIVTNSLDVNYHLSKGIYGVILSKEITKEEMVLISNNSNGRVGVIVHGYLNMSYSKRMLINNYFEHLNKDIDVDDKRSLYLIEQTRDGKMPIIEDSQGTMIFTEYVQESFDEIKELYENNVSMFIVDGIFLDSDKVVDAVKGYSNLLNDIEYDKNEYYEKYNDLPLSTGYMEKATNLVK
ncbi:MAG: U32 family peptidase [Erysipelotrichaceae bacterium]